MLQKLCLCAQLNSELRLVGQLLSQLFDLDLLFLAPVHRILSQSLVEAFQLIDSLLVVTFKLLLFILKLARKVGAQLLNCALVLGLCISDLSAKVKIALFHLSQTALKVLLFAHKFVDDGPRGHKFAGKEVSSLEVGRSHQVKTDVPQVSEG